MADSGEPSDGSYRVPERHIPVPRHLSPHARMVLGQPLPPMVRGYPETDDPETWREHIAQTDGIIMDLFAGAPEPDVEIREMHEGQALAYDLVSPGHDPHDRRVYLDMHGGGLISGGGTVCRRMAMPLPGRLGARVVSVDYRMPPDHPFPAALDDAVAIYRALLRDHSPSQIVIGGASAGGNIAAATILRARAEGLPLPAGAVLLTPELDLTESGDSFHANLGVDRVLRTGLMPANRIYAGKADLADPLVSPLFGDFTQGFPRTFLMAGTRDLFLSNTVRMHRALRNAGVEAELHVVEAASHGGLGGAPEDEDINREMRRFCEECWDGR